MATHRPAKMASLVRQIVSEAIAQKLNDPRISPLASVTRVEVSGDLQVAKVYVSVMGSEAEGRTTLRGLTHAAGHIQRLLSEHWHARHCPEIRFVLDDSIKGAARTVAIIEESLKDSGAIGAAEEGPGLRLHTDDADGASA